MSYDYNETGHDYSWTAMSDEAPYLAMLSDAPRLLFSELEKQISAEYLSVNDDRKRILFEASGCLDQLRAFLYQLNRIVEHAESLKSIINQLPEAPLMALYALNEACYDFENLLFIARASLDRIAFFISQRSRESCSSYDKLSRILKNRQNKDEKARQILSLMEAATSFIGILTDKEDGKKGLRNWVAHMGSVREGRKIAVTVHRLDDHHYLIFDSEIFGYPLFASSEKLSSDIPFLVLNSIATYLEHEILSKSDFTLKWHNPTVPFSEFLDISDQVQRFTVGSVFPGYFRVQTESLRSQVLEKVITLAP